ncbi:MAG: hypothetical protein JNG90_09165 [Planctomycetaceae bacterium]|nr:hypothetical protein [Planctomycetaceae bacterium]
MVTGLEPQTAIAVSPVKTAAEMDAFVDLPWRIYAGDKNWVPPLKNEFRRLLDPARHPFWLHGRRELFLARRGNQVVGRIAAIVDDNYNRFHEERMGIWGFFECLDDPQAAAALFAAAENWCRAEGMTFIRGPLNPSTNYEIGLLLEGFEYPPTIMMTYNPRYYLDLVSGCGYVKEKDLLAFLINWQSNVATRVSKLAARIKRNNHITIRKAERKKFDRELSIVKKLYDSSLMRNWGFVPMTDAEIEDMGKLVAKIGDEDLVFFVNYNDEPVGLCIILPDVNRLLMRLNGKLGLWGILKALWYRKEVTGIRGVMFGFLPEYQKIGLPLVAFDYVNEVLRRKNYQYFELGWNLEDNEPINQFDREVGGTEYKKYRIYRKPL